MQLTSYPFQSAPLRQVTDESLPTAKQMIASKVKSSRHRGKKPVRKMSATLRQVTDKALSADN